MMKPDWSFREILFWSRRRKAEADEPDGWFPDTWAGAGLFSCELLTPEELASCEGPRRSSDTARSVH
jgi:hypothetical protein